MRRLIFLLVSLSAISAAAQTEERSSRNNPHHLSAVGGFSEGGFTFGVAYEHLIDNSTGLGAHVRVFNKDDSAPGLANGIMIVGAVAGHHFYKKNWDLAFTPSFNIINIDSVVASPDDASVVGPGLSISLLYNLTPNLAMGFDNSRYWVWFDDDYAGLAIDDFAIKVKMSF